MTDISNGGKTIIAAIVLYYFALYLPDIIVIITAVAEMTPYTTSPTSEDVEYWLRRVGTLPLTNQDIRYLWSYFGSILFCSVSFVIAMLDVCIWRAKFLRLDKIICILLLVISLLWLLFEVTCFSTGDATAQTYSSLLILGHRSSLLMGLAGPIVALAVIQLNQRIIR